MDFFLNLATHKSLINVKCFIDGASSLLAGEEKNQHEVQFLTPNNRSHVHTRGEHNDLINLISLNSLTDI